MSSTVRECDYDGINEILGSISVHLRIRVVRYRDAESLVTRVVGGEEPL